MTRRHPNRRTICGHRHRGFVCVMAPLHIAGRHYYRKAGR